MKLLSSLILILSLFTCQAEINVKEYGAKGDGVTDDTDAIQKVLDSNNRQGQIIFPAGVYLISKTIFPKNNIIVAAGEVTIKCLDKSKDILYFENAWRVKLEGITFEGGKTQVSLGNKNIDKGQIVLAGCRFYNSSDVAVITRKGSNSTFLTIREGIFVRCLQAVISNCDWTTIRDTWITTSPAMSRQAAIINVHGTMTVDNLLGVPASGNGKIGQRWIDNYGSLICTNSRFGGEGGGFTPVYNFAKYSPQGTGNAIIIQNSVISAQNNLQSQAVIYCAEIPNIISLLNNSLTGIKALEINPAIDLKNYFEVTDGKMLKFESSNIGESSPLPELLKMPLITPFSIHTQLSRQETRSRIEEILKSFENSSAVPAGNIKIQPEQWTLEEYMDASSIKNSEYLSIAHLNDRIVLMARTDDHNIWPHVEVHNVKVNLDKFPVLQLKISPLSTGPFQTAIKVIDVEGKKLYSLVKRTSALEQTYNLNESGLNGEKTLTLKIYYIHRIYAEETKQWTGGKAGEFILFERLDFVKK